MTKSDEEHCASRTDHTVCLQKLAFQRKTYCDACITQDGNLRTETALKLEAVAMMGSYEWIVFFICLVAVADQVAKEVKDMKLCEIKLDNAWRDKAKSYLQDEKRRRWWWFLPRLFEKRWFFLWHCAFFLLGSVRQYGVVTEGHIVK